MHPCALRARARFGAWGPAPFLTPSGALPAVAQLRFFFAVSTSGSSSPRSASARRKLTMNGT